MSVHIILEQQRARTSGLAEHGQRELSARVANVELLGELEAFLSFVSDYIVTAGTRILPEQTLAYGYWATKFVEADNHLEAWEYKPDASEFVPGVTLTVTYWRDQHRTCDSHKAEFAPPRPDRMIVISEGVLEGDSTLQGVRYPSPEGMSGWWLTTDRFDGDITSLKTVHAYHLTAARPDLAHLLALPYGFRFDLRRGTDIWFDDRVALEEAV